LIYAAPAADGLRIAELDGLTALYHRQAAVTHVVGEPVPQILAALNAEPLAVDGLLAALELDASQANRAALTARLDELMESGLVTLA
jgi:PqqD family protein of HPr-rel-A system